MTTLLATIPSSTFGWYKEKGREEAHTALETETETETMTIT